jgi:hypothetical protein
MKLINIFKEIKINSPGWKNFDLHIDEDLGDLIVSVILTHPELKHNYHGFIYENGPQVVIDVEGYESRDLINLLTKHNKSFEEIRSANVVEIPISLINMPKGLNEIRVNKPNNPISALENYKRQILSTNDPSVKKQLVLKCAELVLPIFERYYVNDKRPRKAVEAAKTYLLDPTRENKDILRVAKSGAQDANNDGWWNGVDNSRAAITASAAIYLAMDAIYGNLAVSPSVPGVAIKAAKLDQNLQEIKVNVPGLVGKLENYKRQIESTGDPNVKKELALKCAELVLPIFEKRFPNDKRPHKAIKAAKNYILNPTDRNLTAVAIAAVKSEDATYTTDGENSYNSASAVAFAASEAARTIMGYTSVAKLAVERAIDAAKLDANKPLDEIKINTPGLTSTLENYKRQIESTGDPNVKKELALKGAELVLPIFEKQFPNDNNPHKYLEMVRNYLKNPTEENKDIIDDFYESVLYNINEYEQYRGAAFWAYYAISFAFFASVEEKYALHTITRAIKSAKLAAGQPIDEIKITPPQNIIKPDEYETVYELFQGERSSNYINAVEWDIDFNLISKDYFTNSNFIYPQTPFIDAEDYDDMAKYLDKTNILLAFKALPVIEMENPYLYSEANEDKYPSEQQYYILKYDNRFYFVDTQGYNNPRYITYLKNFPL